RVRGSLSFCLAQHYNGTFSDELELIPALIAAKRRSSIAGRRPGGTRPDACRPTPVHREAVRVLKQSASALGRWTSTASRCVVMLASSPGVPLWGDARLLNHAASRREVPVAGAALRPSTYQSTGRNAKKLASSENASPVP